MIDELEGIWKEAAFRIFRVQIEIRTEHLTNTSCRYTILLSVIVSLLVTYIATFLVRNYSCVMLFNITRSV
jgi:hypothetical protein